MLALKLNISIISRKLHTMLVYSVIHFSCQSLKFYIILGVHDDLDEPYSFTKVSKV